MEPVGRSSVMINTRSPSKPRIRGRDEPGPNPRQAIPVPGWLPMASPRPAAIVSARARSSKVSEWVDWKASKADSGFPFALTVISVLWIENESRSRGRTVSPGVARTTSESLRNALSRCAFRW